MNSRKSRREVRIKNYKQLSLLKTALYKYESSTLYLSQSDLSTLGIEWSEMDLQSENEADTGPRFCAPLPLDAIDRAFDKTFEVGKAYEDMGRPNWATYTPKLQNNYYSALELGNVLLNYLGSRGYDDGLIASTNWDRTLGPTRSLPFPGGWYNCDADLWSVIEALGIPGIAQSHLACVLIDGAPADDRLRRSELCCAVEFMMRGILLDSRDEYLVNPVFVYSLSNRDARIVQAHFNGSHLVVRTTQYLNFEEENEENLKLYLRWMMSDPIGPTKFVVDEGRDSLTKFLEVPRTARLWVS